MASTGSQFTFCSGEWGVIRKALIFNTGNPTPGPTNGVQTSSSSSCARLIEADPACSDIGYWDAEPHGGGNCRCVLRGKSCTMAPSRRGFRVYKRVCNGDGNGGGGGVCTAYTPAVAIEQVQVQGQDPRGARNARTADAKADANADRPCVFPFTLAATGTTYTTCTADLDTGGKRWCSTAVDAEGTHLAGNGNWGYCNEGCPGMPPAASPAPTTMPTPMPTLAPTSALAPAPTPTAAPTTAPSPVPPVPPRASCLTTRGTACVLPFTTLDGRAFHACTSYGDPHGRYWCSTATDPATGRTRKGSWGYCSEDCPGTPTHGVRREERSTSRSRGLRGMARHVLVR